ncbi:SDR family NAD(P)-dependent oxidoreductase [Sphingomonas sp. BIUV-7]|uniref:SDR family NAD(P)-dependent oxidoreductase n=1 Tax=Sphingomonas natans TaxID=3063330 RepID=A0ABT8Y8A5_9SPHN|nr:SDR family NAD(P)-dependent oxidoreductase [Sphingomonas sp. BIUV-7]MDO6414543.1 SDR family NAD(P)-dependent oxidoreductase [Sphingomonas sp. BIUV-7]
MTQAGRLAGKVAIITGASKGTGAVMGKQFAEAGARVMLVARSEEAVKQVAAEIGAGALGLAVDVTREDQVIAMVTRAIEEFGQVDILVSNAVIPGQDKYVWEQTLENWNAVFEICITAPMLAAREVLRQSMMSRKSGSIINVSSTAGYMGMPRKSHYVTAKAAQRALTKVIATEAGPYGIRCNCLVPGGIETDLWKNWGIRMAGEQGISFEEWKDKALSDVPLRTISQPEDIGNLALFLASDESRTITGQSINCDAGSIMVG